MVAVNKIDSNFTGLRIAEEESYKTNFATPEWVPFEPNTYGDFGGQVSTTARRPINASRQLQKGVVTDLDASGGFSMDLTQTNFQDIGQGFFFADMRRKNDVGVGRNPRRAGVQGENDDYTIIDIDTTADTITVDSRVAVSAAVALGGTGYVVGNVVEVTNASATITARFIITGVTGGVVDTVALVLANFSGGREGRTSVETGAGAATTAVTGGGAGLTLTVTYGNGLVWQAGELLWMQGNDDAANNGEFRVTSVADEVLTVAENLVTDASPNAAATMTTVGFQAASADINVDTSGNYAAYTSTALDFTTLGLIPGETIFVGGDGVSESFVTDANDGFKRVRSIAAQELRVDKSQSDMVTETGTGLTIRFYFGRVQKNENGTEANFPIRRRSYQQERSLGAPDDAFPTQVQAEYITGAVPGQATFNIPSADKLTVDMTFAGADNETVDGPTPLKGGDRPTLLVADAFNTSSDFSRIRLAQHSTSDEAPTPLFAFAQEITLTVNNNLTPNKAVGTLGAFDVTAGSFQVGGSITAYFANVAAIQAVRDNVDITLDFVLVKGPAGSKAGIAIDLPLITLGDARPNVELDSPITLPLNTDAASGAGIDTALNHTLMFVYFDHLPNAADV